MVPLGSVALSNDMKHLKLLKSLESGNSKKFFEENESPGAIKKNPQKSMEPNTVERSTSLTLLTGLPSPSTLDSGDVFFKEHLGTGHTRRHQAGPGQ